MVELDEEQSHVARSLNGDHAAFESLVRANQRMIHALTYRMTGSMADAEDLAQETFIRAYEQLGTFRGTAKLSTWLYQIAVNTCLNWRQREFRRGHLHTKWAESNTALHDTETDSDHGEESTSEVQAALMKLPAKQRAAIILTVYEGHNHAEAAKILGCSETTVSWRIFAARHKLKRLLKSERRHNE